jgi:hypothetical protein
MSKTVPKADLARLLNLSRSTISAYLRRGMPTETDGRLDEAACRAWIRENVRVQAGLRGQGGRMAAGEDDAPNAGQALTDAKRVRATFTALLAEHRAEKLADYTVAVEAAVQAVADDSAAIKARFRQLPAAVAKRLVDVSTAPEAHSIVYRAVCVALGDISGQPVHDVESKYLKPGEEKGIPADELTLYKVDVDGVCHYIRKSRDEIERPTTLARPERRRSTQAIEQAIAEAGAEDEVDNDLVCAVERAVNVMSLSQAKLRLERAEGALRRAQFELAKRKVVNIDKVVAALTANHNAISLQRACNRGQDRAAGGAAHGVERDSESDFEGA